MGRRMLRRREQSHDDTARSSLGERLFPVPARMMVCASVSYCKHNLNRNHLTGSRHFFSFVHANAVSVSDISLSSLLVHYPSSSSSSPSCPSTSLAPHGPISNPPIPLHPNPSTRQRHLRDRHLFHPRQHPSLHRVAASPPHLLLLALPNPHPKHLPPPTVTTKTPPPLTMLKPSPDILRRGSDSRSLEGE
ncbi:hypothetical protein K440DRAFT_627081 [Wilcoxina mikolae CBS 423.85]|nr:hypothetical protein K440DRAFT_627081 [Wilcoxina mikolae CBS 423.85]